LGRGRSGSDMPVIPAKAGIHLNPFALSSVAMRQKGYCE
jgi:hypothetical protein